MIEKIVLIIGLFFSCVIHSEELSTLDSFRSKVLTSAVSYYFSTRGYGNVENIVIDTTKKNIKFTLLPEGETQKLSISVGSYMMSTINKEDYLILQNVQTNRIWLNRIFGDHMKDGIKIPMGTMTKGASSLFLNL